MTEAGSKSQSIRTVELAPADRLRDVSTPYVYAALIVASFSSAVPFSSTGREIALFVLVVVNSILLLTRWIPDRLVGPRVRFALMVAFGVAGAAVLAVTSSGFATGFPFVAAGHAGFRYRSSTSVPIAVGISLASTVALWVGEQLGNDTWPFLIGLFTGFPVLIGIARRGRVEALANAQMAVREAQRAAGSEAREHALAERARIARDIHDVLAHSLSGVSMQLEMVDALMESDRREQARDALATAQTMVRTGLLEARNAVYALREDVLPLDRAVAELADGAGGQFSVVGSPRPVDPSTTDAVVGCVRESLTNAARHAEGGAVQLTLRYGDPIVVDVHNSAGSPSATATFGSGLGLVGMRERVELVGGTLEAGPDGNGWHVRVTVPA